MDYLHNFAPYIVAILALIAVIQQIVIHFAHKRVELEYERSAYYYEKYEQQRNHAILEREMYRRQPMSKPGYVEYEPVEERMVG